LSKEKKGVPVKRRRPSNDTLNLIVAFCAVLISTASFVATYVQSEAALQEVKAETWPYLQTLNGNYDSDRRENAIYYYLENAGVGPAHVKQFSLRYEGKPITSLSKFVEACCAEAVAEAKSRLGIEANGILALHTVTDTPAPSLLPAGGRALAFRIHRQEETLQLWRAIDEARRDVEASACFCSILDDCYETDFKSDPVEVEACRREPELNFRG
jgi:hypothetical protein